MLKHLYIKNFALIEELDLTLNPGFSVVTGETGAGKSILLGAIGLLTGQRADVKGIRPGAQKCVVEAVFDISSHDLHQLFEDNDIEYDPGDCIVRREVAATGKSRAFVNDTPVALGVLRELGDKLIDIHSQHQNLLLGKQDFQLEVVDMVAGNGKQLAEYKEAFSLYSSKERQLRRLREEIAANKANAELMKFQFDDIDSAHLQIGEQEELETKAAQMSHSEEIKQAFYDADTALSAEEDGISDKLRKAIAAMRSIETLMPGTGDLAARMESCDIELRDIAQEIGGKLSDIDFDPAELDAVNQRIDTIYSLQSKYHLDSVEALLDLKNSLSEKLEHIANSDSSLADLGNEVEAALAECKRRAALLGIKRKEAAKRVEEETRQLLMSLGMPNVKFIVEIFEAPLGENGSDKVAFLFSANKNIMPQPVEQVASGGETARLMLSLKALMSGAAQLPTIIFDEIDTGVSGAIAGKMGEIMRSMGQSNRQVISITHLPQIAALGSTHYKVYKEDSEQTTVSMVSQLDAESRITEIAQMLSGEGVSEAAINNAKELLRQGGK